MKDRVYRKVRPIIRKKINGDNVYCSYANIPGIFGESDNECIGVLYVPKGESTTSQYGFGDFLDYVDDFDKDFIVENLEDNEKKVLREYYD